VECKEAIIVPDKKNVWSVRNHGKQRGARSRHTNYVHAAKLQPPFSTLKIAVRMDHSQPATKSGVRPVKPASRLCHHRHTYYDPADPHSTPVSSHLELVGFCKK
jgi:hypothetical protein